MLCKKHTLASRDYCWKCKEEVVMATDEEVLETAANNAAYILELEAAIEEQQKVIDAQREAAATIFSILDTIETSDSGRDFHPTTISTCRVMDAQKLREALGTLRGEEKE